jgi:hypothetical protein
LVDILLIDLFLIYWRLFYPRPFTGIIDTTICSSLYGKY